MAAAAVSCWRNDGRPAHTHTDGSESLWLTHTVRNGGSPNLARLRWYELSVTANTIAAAPAQQSTYAPSDNHNRFMPSPAVDKSGGMAIGHSVIDGYDEATTIA
jgi:hypothetical protein